METVHGDLARAILYAFKEAHATPAMMAAAELLVARGLVFTAELSAIREDDADYEFVQCLDGMAQMIAEGTSLRPLLKRLERPGQSDRAYLAAVLWEEHEAGASVAVLAGRWAMREATVRQLLGEARKAGRRRWSLRSLISRIR